MSKYIYTSYIKKMIPLEDFDIEKFILEVKKKTCIWDSNSKSYNLKCVRNRETKRKAWEEIGRIFTPNWDTLTPEERQKKVDGLSRKWANIRKYYKDEVRRTANNPPKKRQRRYHHLLTFLDDSVNKKRVSRSNEFENIGKEELVPDDSSDSDNGELFIVEDDEELKNLAPESGDQPVPPTPVDTKNDNTELEKERELIENKSNVSESVVSPVVKNEAPNTEMVKKNPEIMKLLKETRAPPPVNNNIFYFPPLPPLPPIPPLPPFTAADNYNNSEAAEACKKFLLSLVPEVMSLNTQQNMQFRHGIKELLKDIKLKDQENKPKLIPDNYLKKISND